MQDELQQTESIIQVMDSHLCENISIERIGLTCENMPTGANLYDDLMQRNLMLHKCNEEKIELNKKSGDDCTFGQIIIPNEALRARLKKINELQKQSLNQDQSEQMMRLNDVINEIKNDDLKRKAQAVYDASLTLISAGKDVSLVMQNVALTIQLLTTTNPDNNLIDQYSNAAKQANGKASRSWQALGIAMQVLGMATAVCGILSCIGTFGLSVPFGIALAMAVIGGSSSAAGLGFFAKNSQHGLSKAMDVLAENLKSNRGST